VFTFKAALEKFICGTHHGTPGFHGTEFGNYWWRRNVNYSTHFTKSLFANEHVVAA
jgi:hypothetical protein